MKNNGDWMFNCIALLTYAVNQDTCSLRFLFLPNMSPKIAPTGKSGE